MCNLSIKNNVWLLPKSPFKYFRVRAAPLAAGLCCFYHHFLLSTQSVYAAKTLRPKLSGKLYPSLWHKTPTIIQVAVETNEKCWQYNNRHSNPWNHRPVWCWVWVGTEVHYWEEPLLYCNLPLDKISDYFLLLLLVTHILFLHISVLEGVKLTFINSLRAESRAMFSVSCSQWQQRCADDPVSRKPCNSKPTCPHSARHQGVCSSSWLWKLGVSNLQSASTNT